MAANGTFARRAAESQLPQFPPKTFQSCTPLPSVEEIRRVVEDGGGTYCGLWEADPPLIPESIILFNGDHGSTLSLPLSQLSPYEVTLACEASAAQFEQHFSEPEIKDGMAFCRLVDLREAA